MRAYDDRGASEYDDWYEGTGRFAGSPRPARTELLDELAETIATLPPARTFDVACGTAYASRWLGTTRGRSGRSAC